MVHEGARAHRLLGLPWSWQNITVLDAVLAQFPDIHRHGTRILIRADNAASAKAFPAHIRSLRSRGIRTRRSSAIGCCTQPPASPAAGAACTCGSPRPGPGETS